MENNLSELEKAKKLIEEITKSEDELCSNEINEVLKKHNRQLVISGQFQGDKIQTSISLVKAS
jgi:hypothetical protein